MSVTRPVTPLRWLGAVLVPFVVASVYLWLSRSPPPWFTDQSDYAALAFAIATFVVAVLTLPLERKWKVLIVVGGVPLLAAALIVFALVFVGFAFDDWV